MYLKCSIYGSFFVNNTVQRFHFIILHAVIKEKYINVFKTEKTSMMWPSQNFLLYIRNIIKMKVTEWINNLKKYVNLPPPLPPLGIYTTCTNYNNLISKKSKRFESQ